MAGQARSGAESASACMPCSAAELDFRRPNLDFPHSCFRGPNVPPKRMHVRRPNLTFGGRTWVFLQCYFHAKTHLVSYFKTLKFMKTFYKTCLYPSRGLRHPRFHRTVGIPIPESSRVLHSPPLKNIRPRMFLN